MLPRTVSSKYAMRKKIDHIQILIKFDNLLVCWSIVHFFLNIQTRNFESLILNISKTTNAELSGWKKTIIFGKNVT